MKKDKFELVAGPFTSEEEAKQFIRKCVNSKDLDVACIGGDTFYVIKINI